MSPSLGDFTANVARFTGFADLYDTHRPSPPSGLANLIAASSTHESPHLVVDLGSGTGLSTRYWSERAEQVIGVEPSADMRSRAIAATAAANVSYREGFSHATGLPDHCAQAVVCLQALHWMEPQATFAEARRVLEPGGVFVACDYDWPPRSGDDAADAAFAACIQRGRQLEQERGVAAHVRHWCKEEHLERMRTSGQFRRTLETELRHEDTGDAARWTALLLSQGYIVALLRVGVSEEELGITELRRVAESKLGAPHRIWRWQARVRIGIT